MISYGLLDILRLRAGQSSFHIASEKAFRIEFMRFTRDQELGPIRVEGDVVVTCLEGTFAVGKDRMLAPALTQVVIPQGEILKVACTANEGAIQVIWAPPFAATYPG